MFTSNVFSFLGIILRVGSTGVHMSISLFAPCPSFIRLTMHPCSLLLSAFGQAPVPDELSGGLERPWTGPSAGPSRNLGSTGGTPEHR